MPQQEHLEVHIPPGAINGQKIVFQGKADEAPDHDAGDIVFVVRLKEEHPEFKRRGSDLFVERSVTLAEALTGYQGTVRHLDGRVLELKTEPGEVIKPDSFMAVDNEGMPTRGNPHVKGKLYVHFNVSFPKSGTMGQETIRSLRALLPKGKVRLPSVAAPPLPCTVPAPPPPSAPLHLSWPARRSLPSLVCCPFQSRSTPLPRAALEVRPSPEAHLMLRCGDGCRTPRCRTARRSAG